MRRNSRKPSSREVTQAEELRRSLLVLTLVAQGARELARGKSSSQAEVFRELRKRLASR